MIEHHITVERTARYYTLGNTASPRAVWFVLHGYGQLAGRFIRDFRPIDDGNHLIVAPEALSRDYIRGTNGHVGATWMTREDRLAEIDDYVGYLDALYGRVFQEIDRSVVEVTVLGFSQGTATAARWICQGEAAAEQLLLWGGLLPPDLDLERSVPILQRTRLLEVLGDSDEYADAAKIAEQHSRLERNNISFETIGFEGGHIIDEGVLRRIAGITTGENHDMSNLPR